MHLAQHERDVHPGAHPQGTLGRAGCFGFGVLALALALGFLALALALALVWAFFVFFFLRPSSAAFCLVWVFLSFMLAASAKLLQMRHPNIGGCGLAEPPHLSRNDGVDEELCA